MDPEVRQIQLKCVELLDIVDTICRRNSISYSLCGGSVVGAHLYKGCLPWDDDIDLMMTRENYDRFINVARKELNHPYSIHNFQVGDDFSTPFTKIMNDDTTIIQQDGTVSGVFIDITVYDRIPDSKLSKIDDWLWRVSQIVMIGKVRPRRIKDRARNFLINTLLANRRNYLRLFRHIAIMLGGTTEQYSYSELFGAFANTVRYTSEIFENYTYIEFEGKPYMIVRDYVDYLTIRYNRTDFREPKDKQVVPHYRYVNFELPYKEYLRIYDVDE